MNLKSVGQAVVPTSEASVFEEFSKRIGAIAEDAELCAQSINRLLEMLSGETAEPMQSVPKTNPPGGIGALSQRVDSATEAMQFLSRSIDRLMQLNLV